MSPLVETPAYFAMLGLLCGIVGFRIGARIGNRYLLPTIQAFLGFVACVASWRTAGSFAGVAAVAGWAVGGAVVALVEFRRAPGRAESLALLAPAALARLRAQLEAGGAVAPGRLLGRRLLELAAFLVAAAISANLLGLVLGALWLGGLSARAAWILDSASKPGETHLAAWPVWDVLRGAGYAILGVAAAGPTARLVGLPVRASDERVLWILGGATIVLALGLETALSGRWSRRLAAMMRTTLPILILLAVVAVPASAQTLLIANKSDNTVDLWDVARGQSRLNLPTGLAPHEIAVSPDGKRAAISNYGPRGNPGSSLTVIDLTRGKVVSTIDLGAHRRPHGLAWFAKNRLAVTTEDSRHLLVVDPKKGRIVAEVETAQDISHMVAVSADGKRAFVANIGSGTVTAVDLVAGRKLADIATGAGAEGIAITPDGREVWVGNRGADTLSIIDPVTLTTVGEIPCKGVPIRVAVTPDGRFVLVSCADTGEVALFDRATRTEIRRARLDLTTVPDAATRLFGDRFGDSPVPVGLVISPDGRTAWVAATQSDVVVVLDTETLEVRDLLRAGHEPDGMALAP